MLCALRYYLGNWDNRLAQNSPAEGGQFGKSSKEDVQQKLSW